MRRGCGKSRDVSTCNVHIVKFSMPYLTTPESSLRKCLQSYRRDDTKVVDPASECFPQTRVLHGVCVDDVTSSEDNLEVLDNIADEAIAR